MKVIEFRGDNEFHYSGENSLSKKINEWLSKNKYKIIDIKYSTNMLANHITIYSSALVLYDENDNKNQEISSI